LRSSAQRAKQKADQTAYAAASTEATRKARASGAYDQQKEAAKWPASGRRQVGRRQPAVRVVQQLAFPFLPLRSVVNNRFRCCRAPCSRNAERPPLQWDRESVLCPVHRSSSLRCYDIIRCHAIKADKQCMTVLYYTVCLDRRSFVTMNDVLLFSCACVRLLFTKINKF